MEKFKGQKDQLNKKHGTYKNGTQYIRNINDDIMHQCQYCETWFLPTRRFVQKYCSESCRVSACKKRKVGMFGVAGGKVYDRSNVTNQTMVNTFQAQISELRSSYREHTARLEDKIRELEEKVDDESKDTREKIEREADRINTSNDFNAEKLRSIKDKQDWSNLLIAIMPFVGPYVQRKISEAKTDENKSAKEVIDELQGYTELLGDDVPDSVKKNFEDIKTIIGQVK